MFWWSGELDSASEFAPIINVCFVLGCKDVACDFAVQWIVWSEEVNGNRKTADDVGFWGESFRIEGCVGEESILGLDRVVLEVGDSILDGVEPQVEFIQIWGAGHVFDGFGCGGVDESIFWDTVST